MNNKKNAPARRGLAWLMVGLVAFVIFLLSAQPHSAEFTGEIFGQWNSLARHSAHLVEFAFLFTAIRWALGKTFPRANFVGLCLIAFLVCGAYACVDEWHQSFVPGRTSSISHVQTDLIGAGAAASLWLAVGFTRRLTGKNRNR